MSDTQKLHLYHTNDLHSNLDQWPKIIDYIKKQQMKHKTDNEVSICFDIGDHVDRFHPVTEGTEGRGNVDLMNDAGFLNATIGNNEGITFSKKQLNELYDNANFQVLVANLVDTDGNPPHWAKPYDIHTLQNSLKVGVIGVTAPFTTYYELLGWQILDPFKQIEKWSNQIRGQVDILILLSHLGLEADKRIATESDQFDIILGSHTHHVLKNGLHQGKTTIGQAGKFGFNVGKMEIEWNKEHKEIQCVMAECIDVQEHQPDNASEQKLFELTENANQKLNEKVTVLDAPLELEWFKPSPFSVLLSEAIREWCDAEIGMVNAGLLLEGLPTGPVTKSDLHRICPHPINPCRLLLKGEFLKEMIQHALTDEMEQYKIKGLGFRGKVMGKMIFDGVQVESKLLPDYEYHVQKIYVNGEPLDQKRMYSIGTVDMFTFGRLLPSVAYSEEKHYYLPEMLRDVLDWKLKSLKT
ncbi:bifunctional UDP-sugar hydrolase/5'-nucleotidase [Alkalihalobacillus sp. AL-G]|uniref:bifunctional metallophosphatase/5'-nucleotidase n=1 Tax=Alkalihalobacillus sp. AL-G TaxID=2926399 RepID=UPI00272CB4C4|nr:bifunctional UDP-sugar hydrolase/5'-nucleotidase [Alkalihalobacillus sp. AL-G]WLD92703.1 bifunctional metallophosphatase/5'-nucleotidase [Alkalihalobacillus sp. AL-G]